ncbi:MAG: hypothetical protein JNK56_25350 [Myxococcales bacterium]|nr:hypothetical protein [Myxococcales bacterium]
MPALPQVLAGPIVRRVDATGVHVWIALDSQPTKLALEVSVGTAAWGTTTRYSDSSATRIVRLGVGLFVALMCVANLELTEGKIYQYDVIVSHDGKTKSLLDDLGLGLAPLTRPSFLLPRTVGDGLRTVTDGLRIAHASCRKPHGGGYDALPLLYGALLDTATDPATRPQQLYLTGDQVYADDVASDMLQRISLSVDALFGWQERLGSDADYKPVPLPEGTFVNKTKAVLNALDAAAKVHMCPRTAVADGKTDRSQFLQAVGFKARSLRSGERAYYPHHLLGFQEWCAMYLLAWSDKLWSRTPVDIPDSASSYAERGALKLFRVTLPSARKALANIATYMIFDDHDVTDDWFMPDQRERLLGRPVPARIVRNGLLAYAVFQDWGNQPADYAPGTAGAKLLEAVEVANKPQEPPPFASASDETIRGLLNANGANALEYVGKRKKWHYNYVGHDFDAIVLDSRTWRGRHKGLDALINSDAIWQQLKTLDGVVSTRPLVLVSPAPLAGFLMVEVAQRAKMAWRDSISPALAESGDEALDAEAWHFNSAALDKLVDTLRAYRDRIVVLSGDVHYAYTELASRSPKLAEAKAKAEANDTRLKYEFLQLCSSSSKNSEVLTRVLGLTDLVLTSSLNPTATPELSDEEFYAALRAIGVRETEVEKFWTVGFAGVKTLAKEIHEHPIEAGKKYGKTLVDNILAAAKWSEPYVADYVSKKIDGISDVIPDAVISAENTQARLELLLSLCLSKAAPAMDIVDVGGTQYAVRSAGNGTRSVHLMHLGTHALVDKRGTDRYDVDPLVKAWYASQAADHGAFIKFMNYLSVGDTNIGLVDLKRLKSSVEVIHELRWTMPTTPTAMLHIGHVKPYPKLIGDIPPWVSTLHVVSI